MEYRGIDVSSWQGVIDWKKVADHGTEFAIIRITEAGNAIDRYFERNYAGCMEYRIPTGVFLNHKVIFDYLFKSSYMPV